MSKKKGKVIDIMTGEEITEKMRREMGQVPARPKGPSALSELRGTKAEREARKSFAMGQPGVGLVGEMMAIRRRGRG